MDNKNRTQSDIHVKDRDLNHINDVIFKDSIQSAILPHPEIPSSSIFKTSMDSDIISDTPKHLVERASTSFNKNVTDIVKVSSLESGDMFLDGESNIVTNNSSKLIEEDIQKNDDTTQKSYSVSSKETHHNHKELLKDLKKIPDRIAFKISEVADLTGVKPYVLRYWESEFEQLKPKKAMNNRRMYTQKDVTTILLIKKLLYKDKYSIEGAKKALKQLQAEIRKEHKVFVQSYHQQKAIDQLKDLISDISSLKNGLLNPIENDK